jgi:chorismate synthase
VLDGVPPGIALKESDIIPDILRRKSGARGTTPGQKLTNRIFLAAYITDTQPEPLYALPLTMRERGRRIIQSNPECSVRERPITLLRLNFTVSGSRGGGHFSGRLTLPLTAAGSIAKKIIALHYPELSINAQIVRIGNLVVTDPSGFSSRVEALIDNVVTEGDSLGAVIACSMEQVPAGLGEPFFDSVESMLSHILFSIPGIKGITFGLGFEETLLKGSENPHKGGIAGGITNGDTLNFQLAVKPTPTVGKKGRHDACFALRVPVVAEAAAAIVMADFILSKSEFPAPEAQP